MERNTTKALSSDVQQPSSRDASPLTISASKFQRELDLLIEATPDMDCPNLRRPDWLTGGRVDEPSSPRSKTGRLARSLAGFMARLGLR